MPYNPQVQNKVGDFFFEGISSFGNSIAGGISKRRENKKTKELEEKLEQEKARMEHEEYKEYLMRAQALEQDKTKRKGLETKSVGELKGIVQSGLDALTREYQAEQIKNARAQALAAGERTKSSRFGRKQQIDALQQRDDFNRRLNEYGKIGLNDRDAFLRAATETGVVDYRQPGAYISANPDIHGTDDMGVMRPVEGMPGMGYIGTSRSGGQLVPIQGTGARGKSVSPNDMKALMDQKATLIQEAGAGDVSRARLNEIRAAVQYIDSQLPWNDRPANPAPQGPDLEGSSAVRRFNPQTRRLD